MSLSVLCVPHETSVKGTKVPFTPPSPAKPARTAARGPRRALLRHRPCLEGALQDVERPEGHLQDIATGTKAPLAGPGAARPARAAGEARHTHRINHTDSMTTGGSRSSVVNGTFAASGLL